MSSHSIGGNITSSISDHFLQFCQIDMLKTEKEKPSIKFSRNYRNFDKQKFADELMQTDWSDITLGRLGTDNSYQLFYDKILTLLDNMAPFRKLTKNESRLKQRPWITKGLLVSMRKRDDFLRRMSREKDPIFKHHFDILYKKYRNLITILMKQSKKNHYSAYFLNNYNNTKKTWDGIRQLINVSKKKSNLPSKILYKKQEKNTSSDIANSFNDFFSNIGKNVDKKIPNLITNF